MLNAAKESEAAVSLSDPDICLPGESVRPMSQHAVMLFPSLGIGQGKAQPGLLQKIGWASARLLFMVYIGFAMLSLVGGLMSAPLMTQLFFNDWRFWRYWSRGWRLLPHGWKLLWMALRGQGEFMFSVPLTSPPQSLPDRSLVTLSPTWSHGSGCGTCQRCCQVKELRCPVLDESSGFCSGYNSFYWRYFNCGRYPSRQFEIDYYGCGKWLMQTAGAGGEAS